MNINIKDCVGKKIAFKLGSSNNYFLDEGIVDEMINENVVRVNGELLDPTQITVHAILNDSVNESGISDKKLIEG